MWYLEQLMCKLLLVCVSLLQLAQILLQMLHLACLALPGGLSLVQGLPASQVSHQDATRAVSMADTVRWCMGWQACAERATLQSRSWRGHCAACVHT